MSDNKNTIHTRTERPDAQFDPLLVQGVKLDPFFKTRCWSSRTLMYPDKVTATVESKLSEADVEDLTKIGDSYLTEAPQSEEVLEQQKIGRGFSLCAIREIWVSK